MAGISAPGLGSGLDVNGIITQLMAVESQPLQKLDVKEAVYQAEISGYGGLKSGLSKLQSAISALEDRETFFATRGSTSDDAVFSVSADTEAAPSSYDVTVERLAQRHKLGTGGFAADTVFGGGPGDSLTLIAGTGRFDLDLSTGLTLEQIQSAINGQGNTTGISAGLVTGDNGNQTLVLTAGDTGYDNRVQLAYGGGIDAGTFGFATLNRDADGQLLGDDRALDAALQVDGVSVTRGANSISDVVAGVTFQLKGAGRAVATVIKDTSAASNAVNGFVKAYNDLKGEISSLSETTLKGNSLLRSIESRVRGVLNQALTGLGDVTYISQLGITTNQDTGRLQVDSAKLDTALKENADSVAAFFSDTENGFATRMNDVLDGFLASGGIIDNVIEGANSRIDSIDSQRTTLERRLEAIEKRYRNQFTALDNMMARLNTTSDYLTRQLDSLANMLNNK